MQLKKNKKNEFRNHRGTAPTLEVLILHHLDRVLCCAAAAQCSKGQILLPHTHTHTHTHQHMHTNTYIVMFGKDKKSLKTESFRLHGSKSVPRRLRCLNRCCIAATTARSSFIPFFWKDQKNAYLCVCMLMVCYV